MKYEIIICHADNTVTRLYITKEKMQNLKEFLEQKDKQFLYHNENGDITIINKAYIKKVHIHQIISL